MTTRGVVAGLCLAFVLALAVFVGWRLSSEAMAVLVGVLAGVLASVPTSLFVVWVTTRHLQPAGQLNDHVAAPPVAPMPPPQNTPVIVVTSPGQNATGWAQTGLPYPNTAPPNHSAPTPHRQFTVIGGDDQWEQES